MARRLTRGEVWLHRFAAPDKRRPVLLVGRQDAIDFMRTVLVVPITSTIRGLPTEVALGVDDGMKAPCAVTLDHVQAVRQEDLRRWVCTLGPERMHAVCRALAVATACG